MSMTFGKINRAAAFAPTSAFPLDIRLYFESKASALAAAAEAREAGSTETIYHYGMVITVVEDGKASFYQIQPDNTLSSVGGEVAINENVFSKDSDGKLDLYGFADAVAGAQLTKGADGKLSWVKPDTTTVEGLSTAITALETTVYGTPIKDNEGNVTGHEENGLVHRVSKTEQDIATLNGTGEGSVKKTAEDAAAAAINKFATDITDDGVINSYKELIEWVSTHGGDAAQMAADILQNANDIDALEQLVGNKAVATQISEAIAAALQVDGVDKYALASELTIALQNITSLETEVGKKVNAEEGKRLMTDAEGTKLENIEAGAQANKVDSVSEEFNLTEKMLSVKAISQDKVTGLPEALQKKVDAEEGKGLSTEDFTTELKEKLETIQPGDKNLIEKIKMGDTELPITEKTVVITKGTNAALGIVKGNEVENGVVVDDAGAMSVHSLNVNKLVQTEGERLILDGGKAAI